jgi:RNA polymerase sigma-70 factor (ECF subfamily)
MELGRSGASDDGRIGTPGRSAINGDPGAMRPTNGSLDERAIVAAVLGGDRDAFRRLVERESAAVIRACHRILGDHAEAEDAAQEAFVTAYRSLASWRSEGPFGAWLTRIAVRIALRQAGRRRTVAWTDPARGASDGATPSAGAR